MRCQHGYNYRYNHVDIKKEFKQLFVYVWTKQHFVETDQQWFYNKKKYNAYG
jgi:hypothetical protein